MLTLNENSTLPILSVAQLNQQVRYLLEQSFPSILVEGEISNLSKPASGHWYFSLKDSTAQVRCAMFRLQNRSVNFSLQDGLHVIVKAKVALYEGRGEFQLIVEQLEEAGFGALQKAFEALKNKLYAEGLFAEAHKKSLPFIPRQIGIITSATGAALRDILHVLQQRLPLVPVIIYPTLVQGDGAAAQIVQALQIANQRRECDVIILARGGGSLEDLWAFNEEPVAHAIYASELPIVTGIGHQIDFTIADFVADVRAPTPSAAAMKIVPDREELLHHVAVKIKRLEQAFQRYYTMNAQRYDWLIKRLLQTDPLRQFAEKQILLTKLSQRLQFIMQSILEKKRALFQIHLQVLQTVSPLATLARGYAIASVPAGKIIREISDVTLGEQIFVKLEKLTLDCKVTAILDKDAILNP